MVLEPLISGDVSDMTQAERDIWFSMELFFTVIFTIELAVRLLVADALKQTTLYEFCTTPRNVCDFIAVTPLYLELIARTSATKSLALLRVVRLARLSRLARVSRLSKRFPSAAPISVVLVVIWGIFLLKDI